MIKNCIRKGIYFCLLCLGTVSAQTQTPAEHTFGTFAGMWSDPPHTADGLLCFIVCTDAGIDLLHELMDDPANDEVPFQQLVDTVMAQSIGGQMAPLLTDWSRPGFPLNLDESPQFLRCEPPGVAAQMFQPHQLEVTLHADRLELRYGEWDAHRTVWIDGRRAPPDTPESLLGYSTGHMDGTALVISTTHIKAGTAFIMNHSNQLRAEERYTISDDGQMLTLYATFTDPIALTGPVTLKKIWSWSPDERIYSGVDCEIPTDYLKYLKGEGA